MHGSHDREIVGWRWWWYVNIDALKRISLPLYLRLLTSPYTPSTFFSIGSSFLVPVHTYIASPPEKLYWVKHWKIFKLAWIRLSLSLFFSVALPLVPVCLCRILYNTFHPPFPLCKSFFSPQSSTLFTMNTLSSPIFRFFSRGRKKIASKRQEWSDGEDRADTGNLFHFLRRRRTRHSLQFAVPMSLSDWT